MRCRCCACSCTSGGRRQAEPAVDARSLADRHPRVVRIRLYLLVGVRERDPFPAAEARGLVRVVRGRRRRRIDGREVARVLHLSLVREAHTPIVTQTRMSIICAASRWPQAVERRPSFASQPPRASPASVGARASQRALHRSRRDRATEVPHGTSHRSGARPIPAQGAAGELAKAVLAGARVDVRRRRFGSAARGRSRRCGGVRATPRRTTT